MMTMRSMFKKIPTKAVRGPGGITCPCCRFGALKSARTLHNRLLRRRAAREISAELAEIEEDAAAENAEIETFEFEMFADFVSLLSAFELPAPLAA